MANTVYHSGRLGNIVFSTAFLLAYCKKYDLKYFNPSNADAYREHSGHISNPFSYIQSTGHSPFIRRFQEPNMTNGTPFYQELPKMDGTIFDGYWQSFKYFDWCRPYILEKFNLPQKPLEVMSINTRRGDCINSPNFPIAPLVYYKNAVKFAQEKGINKFKVFGDDIRWNKAHFTKENFPNAEFIFSEGKSEMQDYTDLQNCSLGNITARSTFSLTAAWMNQSPNKLVLVPTTKFEWWRGMNKNLLTDTGFIEIDFDQRENLTEEKQY